MSSMAIMTAIASGWFSKRQTEDMVGWMKFIAVTDGWLHDKHPGKDQFLCHIATSRESGLVLDVERAGSCGTYRTRMLFYFVDVPYETVLHLFHSFT